MTAQRNNSKLLWGIIGVLIVAAAIVFGYFKFLAPVDASSEQVASSEPVTSSTASSEVVLTETEVATSETITSSALISEDVLTAPISENASLAKEEVAKLDDIQAQLKDQEKLLQEQHADADQLIQLKEEQIKLLEAQLAESK